MTQKKKYPYSFNFIDVAIVLFVLAVTLVAVYVIVLRTSEDSPEELTQIEYTLTINDVDVRLLPLIQLGSEIHCAQTATPLGRITSIATIPLHPRVDLAEDNGWVYRIDPRYVTVELPLSAYALSTPYGFMIDGVRLNVMSEIVLLIGNFFASGQVNAIAEAE